MEVSVVGEEMLWNMISQSPFMALFVWLLLTTQKKNDARELRYQEAINQNQIVIQEQAKSFGSISKDVTEIKQKLFEGDVA
ncbi:involved in bacteriocin production or immunity [Bacillus phage VMY22]|uniref:Bacteriocin biosynthesis protein n=1 Tax=Bacillus phage VMY22 TaxID=1734382 RepID=A0A0N9S837_9CAUD|nr:involved in bacteriocin production or immunity [Bacillus phage VMY22]ALH46484.1 bacteriocin biosynthesis protein [Bacillus phage VMY22]